MCAKGRHEMTPANVYRRRGHDECRTCNREDQRRYRDRNRRTAGKVICQCGCGSEVPAIRSNGRPQTYAVGHNRRGKPSPWLAKEIVKPRTSHEKAVKIKAGVTACEWAYIGDCLGRLDVAHVNGDEMDNRPENLLKLCRSHHFLMDRGRIDPAAPVMPPFIVSGGKRRYR